MRKIIVCIAALLLSACGGETYQMAPIEAFNGLSSIGTTPGMSPLPGGLSPVQASFESVPGDNLVRWSFTHEGDDIGQIIAKVEPDGASASKVTVYYADGAASDDHWRNGDARRLIKQQIQRLVVEAVDSKLKSRPFDETLKKDVAMQVTTSSLGAMMNDASAAMDEYAEKSHKADQEGEARRAQLQAGRAASQVGKPALDLSGNNK
jgi:hypothetical protein